MVRTKGAEFVSTASVRRAFLDFFHSRGHALLPGSPVLPLGDPSVPFVPAGMHQFRHVLLGQTPAPAPQVANSQRCIRVGGRHCDLATVGTDGSHLTFFEMLGSWTFGATSYWKREVCADALQFLTGPLRVDPVRLHVTYFGGDAESQADLECQDAWQSLGISKDRIHRTKDNMWEMGTCGPCGPCTEIHIDGVEIWNLVFIQQERSLNGLLTPLEVQSVDTGMGLERLSALLAGYPSVYDTDVFQPLLETVTKLTKAPTYSGKFENTRAGERDAAYRLLVDHARTIAVALADGIVPNRHYKLRRIIRKCIIISERNFGIKDATKAASLLEELAVRAIDNLSKAHPTLTAGLPAVRELLRYEAGLFSNLRKKDPAGWAEAVAQEPRLAALAEGGVSRHVLLHTWRSVSALALNGVTILPGTEAYRFYDTHGISLDILDDLAKFSGMQGVDSEGFKAVHDRQKDLSRLKRSLGKDAVLTDFDVIPKDLPPTDTSSVYSYVRTKDGKYSFPSVASKVLALVQEGKLVDKAHPNSPVGVVLTTTNMYRNLGGQHADTGYIETSSGAYLKVVEPIDVGSVVIHWAELQNGSISVGEEVQVSIDQERRLLLSCNHTAAHLFNSCLRQFLPVATQKRAPVLPNYFGIALESYGRDLTDDQLESVEKNVRHLVKSSLPVARKKVTPWNWHSAGPTIIIPDAAYPALDLNVVEIGTDSRELCGGTHITNTLDIGDVCILKSAFKGGPDVIVVTGDKAVLAVELGKRLLENAQALRKEVDFVESSSNIDHLLETWQRCKQFIDNIKDTGSQTSYFFKQRSIKIIEEAIVKLEDCARMAMKREVAGAVRDRFAAVFVRSPSILESVQLLKLTRPLPDKALLLLTLLRDGSVRGRCCVPQDLVSNDFNAERWLGPVAEALKGRAVPPRGFDAKNICIIEDVTVNPTPETVKSLVDEARKFAEEELSQRVACA